MFWAKLNRKVTVPLLARFVWMGCGWDVNCHFSHQPQGIVCLDTYPLHPRWCLKRVMAKCQILKIWVLWININTRIGQHSVPDFFKTIFLTKWSMGRGLQGVVLVSSENFERILMKLYWNSSLSSETKITFFYLGTCYDASLYRPVRHLLCFPVQTQVF